jgi:Protein of unknown function (DUF3131)
MSPPMDSNLSRARGSIVWLLALACAFGAVWWIERESGRALADKPSAQAPAASSVPQLAGSADLPPEPAPRALSAQERQWARIAWKYFENNVDAGSGLARSVDGFPSATLWDTASYLLALLSAQELELVEKRDFDLRIAKALVALERMPLYDGKLPNKAYDTATLAMTDYRNQPAPAGIGWSAIDIGRLLVPLNALVWRHPVHTPAARRVLARWDTSGLAREGQLFAMQAGPQAAPQALQEGRLGYEQYAAHTFALLGLDVEAAGDWLRHLQLVPVEGVAVCADDRDPARFGAPNYVVSEPYILAGLEFGWTRSARECAWRAYRAQEARWRRTGTLTAVTEDHVDRPPYFVYNSVWSNGRPWATVTEKGEDVTALRNLSVKAAFGWHALLRTEYTARLVERVAGLNDPARGWYAGLYEEGGQTNEALAANTNAVVLESLAYLRRGRLLQYR